MRIGIQLPTIVLDSTARIGERLAWMAMQAEQAGFTSLWIMDHFFVSEETRKMFTKRMSLPNETTSWQEAKQIDTVIETLESWTTLAYLAGTTKTIQLGTLVSGVTYRYPGVLIKMVNTLDALSHGRAYLGVGAAWEEDEHHRLGISFLPLAARFELLDDLLQLALQMWSQKDLPFDGKHIQISTTAGSQLCFQRPHPRLLVGGDGEKKTLRLVAQYADACNLHALLGMEALKRKLQILREHCCTYGRSYDAIEKTVSLFASLSLDPNKHPGTMAPQEIIDSCAQLADAGFDHVILNMMPDAVHPAAFDVFGSQIIPAIKQMPVRGRL